MRCYIVHKIDHYLFNVAPTPALRRIIAFDYWMACFVKVLGRMPVRRVIAAAYMSAGATGRIESSI